MLQKSIIIILIFTLASFNSKAQYQSIFGLNSTEWVFEWHNLGIDGQDTAYVEKDTIAFGHSWKKLLITREPFYKGALLREDTTIGKVWYKGIEFVSSQLDTTTQLLYDFSLNLNDTFDVSNMWTGYKGTSTQENTVDSIYYLNGKKNIRFKGKYSPNASPENYQFIEGIGGNLGIFWKQYFGLQLSQYLLCSYKDGLITSYINKRYNGNCNVFGVNNIIDIKSISDLIKIYPNPSNASLHIENEMQKRIAQIKIFDFHGKLIGAHDYSRIIDISNLFKGNYFIQFVTKDNIKLYKIFTKN